jgi:hypothetical protein
MLVLGQMEINRLQLACDRLVNNSFFSLPRLQLQNSPYIGEKFKCPECESADETVRFVSLLFLSP